MALDVSEAVAAQMAGRTVRCSILVYMDFLSGPVRAWPGTGAIVSGGHTWSGLTAELVSVDPGTLSKDGSAEPFAVGVSGVSPTFLSKVVAAENEAINRSIAIYLQFFNEDWSTLDGPISLRQGRMTGFSFSGAGIATRSIIVRAEGALIARGRPPLTYLSDAEQQYRYPGDLGAEFIPAMQHSTVTFPK